MRGELGYTKLLCVVFEEESFDTNHLFEVLHSNIYPNDVDPTYCSRGYLQDE